MDLRLSDEQQLLGQTTRRFLERSCPLSEVRGLADRQDGGFSRPWWHRGAELGWTSLLAPEALGGGSSSGGGVMDLAIVAEEMGRVVSPGPLLPTNVVVAALARAPDPHAYRKEIGGLIDGQLVGAWCMAEPRCAWDGHGMSVRARPVPGGVVVDGIKRPVEAAVDADLLLVTARTGAGFTQVLVPAGTPGVAIEPLTSLDLVRRFAEVRFDGVEVPTPAVVGEVGEAAEALAAQLQLAVVVQCAEMVGATHQMFERTVAYAADRRSFGRTLDSYQALKHRMADMKMWVEAMQATAAAAARAIDRDDRHASELASVAKSIIGDRAPAILQDCVQIHGGIAVTWDHDLHLYLRRVVQDRALFGTPSDHREHIARLNGL